MSVIVPLEPLRVVSREAAGAVLARTAGTHGRVMRLARRRLREHVSVCVCMCERLYLHIEVCVCMYVFVHLCVYRSKTSSKSSKSTPHSMNDVVILIQLGPIGKF